MKKLGFGCMRLPLLDQNNQKSFDMPQLCSMVDAFLERGFTYFDTAYMYHDFESERVMKQALIERHPRETFLLATKLPTMFLKEAPDMERIFSEQLEKTGAGYFDYYLLHSLNEENYATVQRLDAFGFCMRKKQEGLIRRLGFSFHDSAALLDKILTEHPETEFDQLQLNYLDWKHASGRNVNADYLYGELEKRGVPAIIMEPLLGGRLSNVPDHIVARLKQQRPENSVASWAFRFAGSPDGVLTVLSGMTYMEHLQDNIRTYSPLILVTDEEKDFLEETAQLMMKYPTIPCNDCKYCMPCPYALDIPGILLHYNKCVNEGNVPKSAQDENYAKARRAFLVGYDRSVPKLRQANHCTGCEQCNPHCPQGIDIPKEMQRIDKFVEELKVNG